MCNDVILISRTCNGVAHDLASLEMSWDPGEILCLEEPLPGFVRLLVARDSVESSVSITRPALEPAFLSKKNLDLTPYSIECLR
jgi:hypothetical protein